MTKKFCVGDRVSFGGIKGTLRECGLTSYPLRFTADPGEALDYQETFTEDGRFHVQHTKPLLKKLVKRKKKKEPVPEDCYAGAFNPDTILEDVRVRLIVQADRINFLLAEARRRRGE